MSTNDEIEQMISDIEARESKLSDWERGFVDSISSSMVRHGRITDTQDAKLTEIWDRVTS